MALAALAALTVGALTAVVGGSFVSIVRLGQEASTHIVPQVTKQQQDALVAAQLSRLAEVILNNRSRQTRTAALAEAENLASRFAAVVEAEVFTKLDLALHAVRRSSYRSDVIEVLQGTIDQHAEKAAEILGVSTSLAAVTGQGPEAYRLLNGFFRLQQMLAAAGATQTPEDVNRHEQSFEQLVSELRVALDGLETGGRQMGELLDRFQRLRIVFDLHREQLNVQAQMAQDTEGAHRLLRDLAASLAADAADTAAHSAQTIVDFGRRGLMASGLSLGVTVLLLAGLSLLLRRHVLLPVRRVTAALETVQSERRPVQLPPARLMEFDAISRSVERFAQSLVETHEYAEALKASEERLRAILTISPFPILITREPEGRLIFANHRAVSLLELRSDSPEDFLFGDFLPTGFRENFEVMLRRARFATEIELPLKLASGRAAWVLVSVVRIESQDAPAMLVALNDITERKQFEEELRRAKDAAETASSAKSEFLAVMSHEIRTPMNGILGMTQLVLDGHLEADQRERLEAVRHSGEALLTILNDILDFSKLEVGRIGFEAVNFDLHRTIAGVVGLMSSRAQENTISLESSINPDLPRWLVGDAARLRQVLLNLIGNAIKFTERGGIRVLAEAMPPVPGEPMRMRFSVVDTGIGIPDEAQAGLFQSFTQADSSISRRFGGTGLGLAICKRIVEAQGGAIGVISAPGRGSTFWFTLPFRPGQQPSHDDEAAVAPARDLAPLRILLAEDNPVNQRVATGMLVNRGHAVSVVPDGLQAVAAVERGEFDLVLMDVQMPVMDGLEATRAIRALSGPKASLPIIALTANALKQDDCLAAGMNDFVPKPFNPHQLFSVLARWSPEAAAGAPPPPPAEPTSDVFDRRKLLRLREDVGHQAFGELVPTFRSSGEALLADIVAADAKGDLDALGRAAHAFKSSSGSLGFNRLSALCRDAETASRDRDLDAAQSAARRIPEAYAEARDLLDRFMAEEVGAPA
ncbi:MAG: response regulator [Alphaproteobacteria bacterium]|nr:response regulator [Alphaproteobacteria bacterium]